MTSYTCIFWTLLIYFSLASCAIIKNSPCKVKYLDGTCEPITSCKFAMSILAINDIQTLRSMFCGYDGNLPMVCCPVNNDDKSSTVNPIQVGDVKDQYDVKENEVITPPPPTGNPLLLPGRDVCGQLADSDRIFGGQIADIDEFPWIARIKFFKPSTRKEYYGCSGTLISDRYVLTAAHCLVVNKIVSVRLGEWDTATDVDCQDGYCNDGPLDLKVDNITIHPGFDRRNLSYGDIALMRLEKPVKFTDFIRPVCLPTSEYIARQDYIDSTYTTAGWGITEFGQESQLLRKVNLDAVFYSICVRTIQSLPEIDDPYVICAGGKNGRDSCRGDSGGPLLRVVKENYKLNWYIYGITSHGVIQCGTAGKPSVYTRVSKYMDWILQNVSGG